MSTWISKGLHHSTNIQYLTITKNRKSGVMWNRNVIEMTDDEIATEIKAVDKIQSGLTFTIDELVNRKVDTSFLRDINLSMTANKMFFQNDKQGFLPRIVEKLSSQREDVKEKMLVADSDVELLENILTKRGLRHETVYN